MEKLPWEKRHQAFSNWSCEVCSREMRNHKKNPSSFTGSPYLWSLPSCCHWKSTALTSEGKMNQGWRSGMLHLQQRGCLAAGCCFIPPASPTGSVPLSITQKCSLAALFLLPLLPTGEATSQDEAARCWGARLSLPALREQQGQRYTW